MDNLSQEFLAFYESKFKPVALKCSEHYSTLLKFEKGEIKENDFEMESIKKLHDALAAWYVGVLVGDIERAKFGKNRLNLINSLSKVHGTLNSESYWANVWKNDESTEEANNLKELAGMTKELMSKL